MDQYDNIFNWPAFIIGTVSLLLCLGLQGGTVAIVMKGLKPRIRAMSQQKRTVMAHFFFISSTTSLLLSHLLQIYILAEFLYRPGIITSMRNSILYAASTYTTVGFINDPLPLQWQLMTITMAVTGLFAFAWSTSILYAVSQEIYPAED